MFKQSQSQSIHALFLLWPKKRIFKVVNLDYFRSLTGCTKTKQIALKHTVFTVYGHANGVRVRLFFRNNKSFQT